METKIGETVDSVESMPLYSIRWSAVFASLVVGIGVQILLMLAGAAAGLAVYGGAVRTDDGALPMAALAWNGASLFIAALVGGYVAGRAAGLRRSIDGMLHGVVSWGAALLCFIVVTGSLTGSVFTSVFSLAGTGIDKTSASAVTDLLADVGRGDRDATVRSLRDGFGLTQEQAAGAADRALSMNGRGGEGTPNAGAPGAETPNAAPSRMDAQRAAKMASTASAWLSLMVLLSMIAGALGGLLGARGARQRGLHGRHAHQRVFRHRGDVTGIPDAS